MFHVEHGLDVGHAYTHPPWNGAEQPVRSGQYLKSDRAERFGVRWRRSVSHAFLGPFDGCVHLPAVLQPGRERALGEVCVRTYGGRVAVQLWTGVTPSRIWCSHVPIGEKETLLQASNGRNTDLS